MKASAKSGPIAMNGAGVQSLPQKRQRAKNGRSWPHLPSWGERLLWVWTAALLAVSTGWLAMPAKQSDLDDVRRSVAASVQAVSDMRTELRATLARIEQRQDDQGQDIAAIKGGRVGVTASASARAKQQPKKPEGFAGWFQ